MGSRRGAVSSAVIVTLVSVLWGLTRYVDELVEIFLRQSTGMSLPAALARNFRLGEALGSVILSVAFGLGLSVALVALVQRWGRTVYYRSSPFEEARWVALPLLVPVGLTALSCLALAASPQFPYGLNFALTLTYEGAFKTLLTAGLLGATGFFVIFGAPEPGEGYRATERAAWLDRRRHRALVILAATAVFAALTPRAFLKDGEGQGNSLKYLRMAAALAGSGSLDIARAGDGPRATPLGFAAMAPRMAARFWSETTRLGSAVRDALGERKIYIGSNKAQMANRAMFRSPDGGIYYINAPGPALLILPAYLVDRVLNRWRGTERQIAVLLFWNFLGALLLLEMAQAARDLTLGEGAALLGALLLAASPPVLLYTHHVYPELPAALLLLVAFRRLLMDAAPSVTRVLVGALAIGFLPWLHQKYSVTAAVLGLAALFRVARMNVLGRLLRLFLLSAPLAFSLAAILVYNHALTGSVLPDAPFRAVGRVAFQPETLPTGVVGLLLDVENGLFVYAPVYLLALAGLKAFATEHGNSFFYWAIAIISYVAVVAAFPYWPGAVSAVGRYMLGVAPLAVLPLCVVIERARRDGAVAGVVVALAAASIAYSVSFHTDTIPAYETYVLLERALFSDPYQYLPSFLNAADPAHLAKLGAAVLAVFCIVIGVARRLAEDRLAPEEASPRRVFYGAMLVLALFLGGAALLERLPPNTTKKEGPVFRDTASVGGFAISGKGEYGFEEGRLTIPEGSSSRFLIRASTALPALRLTLVSGSASKLTGQRTLDVSLAPGERREILLPLGRAYVFEGPKGQAWFYRVEIESVKGATSLEIG